MLRLRLYDYSDMYILVKGTITIANTAAQGAAANNDDNCSLILLWFKNCALFINCISKTNNTQVDEAHDIDAVTPKYNLITYRDNYLRTSRIFNILEMKWF